MKVINKILISVFALALNSQASAANYQGVVTNVFPYYDRVYIVLQNGWFDATSNCHAGHVAVYSFDPATSLGRSLLAVALSAKLSGVVVYAASDGSCIANSPFSSKNENLVGLDLKG